MILSAGPPNSVSFTDDTSLDARKTAGSKISIHCQVLRERPLDWYNGLLRRTPSKAGELKFNDVTYTFLSLSNSEKRKITNAPSRNPVTGPTWSAPGAALRIQKPLAAREVRGEAQLRCWRTANAIAANRNPAPATARSDDSTSVWLVW